MEKGADCEECPEGSICKGEGLVGPGAGYWRLRDDLDVFIKCRTAESCAGADPGVSNQQLSNFICKGTLLGLKKNFCSSGFCTERYFGNFCSKCRDGFAVSNEKQCVPCQDNASYLVLSVLAVLFAVAFIVFTVRNALVTGKKASKNIHRTYNQRSLLIKIAINYFQIVSIVSTIDFKWNDESRTTVEYQGKIVSSVSEIFSVDCIINNRNHNSSEIEGQSSGRNSFFLKLILIVCTPIIFGLISFIVWSLVLLLR